jgi:succinate dehydrogenase hydrophobic anchor subunit
MKWRDSIYQFINKLIGYFLACFTAVIWIDCAITGLSVMYHNGPTSYAVALLFMSAAAACAFYLVVITLIEL